MFKENINKIHYDLSNIENHDFIKIEEKSSLRYGEYIEISMLKENKELVSIIKKSDLNNDNFKWEYKANPKDENSILVERFSNVYSFSNDVNDIFENNRFDSDYDGFNSYDEDFIEDIQNEMKRAYELEIPKYKVIEFLDNVENISFIFDKSFVDNKIFDTTERENYLNYITAEVVGQGIPYGASVRMQEEFWITFRERMKDFGYEFV